MKGRTSQVTRKPAEGNDTKGENTSEKAAQSMVHRAILTDSSPNRDELTRMALGVVLLGL